MDVRLAPGAPDACFRRRFEASFIGGMEPVLAAMGMSPDEFERRMAETGVVRTVEVDGGKAGFVWTELRGRTLHVHALLLDEAFRGPGIGSTVLRLLDGIRLNVVVRSTASGHSGSPSSRSVPLTPSPTGT